MPCENFLYGFKGACGASRAGSPPRRAQARRHPRRTGATARRPGWGREAPRRGRGGSVAASFGRWPCGRGGCPAPLATDPPWRMPAVSLAGTPADATARPLALGILLPRKITVKSAPYGRVLRMALRATLECDLPRQDLGTYRGDGLKSILLVPVMSDHAPVPRLTLKYQELVDGDLARN